MGKKIGLNEAAECLRKAKSVIITAHVSPDGDAIGSTLALCAYMRAAGKKADVVIDDKLPKNMAFLPGYDAILRPAYYKGSADLLVIIDTDTSRIEGVAEIAKGLPVLNIDHHISNNEMADYIFIEKRAAACEMVYEILTQLKADITLDIALPLYTGLATDTGFFKFSNTRSSTMRAAAALIDAGVQPNVVSEATEAKSEAIVRGQMAALQTMEVIAGGRVAGLFLGWELMQNIESTDGFIDMVRVIEGVDVAVLIKCVDENVCRVSMRSKGLDVSKVAGEFGGGGHIRAAGCTLKMALPEAKKEILEAIERALEA
ncbi:MAG: bifunctional oligoribonuclease/PAP phosphatase NrnA [Schwartzia sp.]|nr:bifunctional oligoribonuclease/PAP phosphatase NrnA [Schwartzia sp. (in: firmicutes)]